MRIIAGEFRGRRLAAPEGTATRPLLDRVREALFSTLGDLVDGARVLDLFAGSGALGLEALSRGAALARFVEADRRVLRQLVANVEALGVEERVEATLGDALDARTWGAAGSELVFLDPPYPLARAREGRERLVAAIAELGRAHLARGGWIVLRSHPRDFVPGDFGPGWELDRRDYGNSTLWYLTGSIAGTRS